MFDRDTSGSRRFLRKLLYSSTDPSRRFVELISFSALHNVCERVSLMSLDAQQRYSHCFLDGLYHPIISYHQNASRSNFLGLKFILLFLGFPLVFLVCFFRLISEEAYGLWSIRSGQPRFFFCLLVFYWTRLAY